MYAYSSVAGAVVQKISAFAWDPDFICSTNQSQNTLTDEITSDGARPIISKCSFHSSANRSVVVIGYNLLGETQGFTVGRGQSCFLFYNGNNPHNIE